MLFTTDQRRTKSIKSGPRVWTKTEMCVKIIGWKVTFLTHFKGKRNTGKWEQSSIMCSGYNSEKRMQ